MSDTKPFTHTAYTLKREGRRHGRWLEIGEARFERNGVIHVFLNRTPIGGFNGYAYLAPIGAEPPPAEPERAERPSEQGEENS